MKIKVGKDWYDSKDIPIMIVLSDRDKENIASMPKDAYKYASFPENMSISDIKKWMNVTQLGNAKGLICPK